MSDDFGTPFNKIIKEGILLKVSENLDSYNERYVILGERRIAFYLGRNKNNLKLNGEFYLRRESSVDEYKYLQYFGFYIQVNDPEESEYRFLCKSPEEAEDWMRQIINVINDLRRLPNTMYFIPKLKTINPYLGDFQLPKDFPPIILKRKGERQDFNINEDIFRPEDLTPIIDPNQFKDIKYPFPIIPAIEYQCRKYPWGIAISAYLKFTYEFANLILKLHNFFDALWNSDDGSVPKSLDFSQYDIGTIYSDIYTLLNNCNQSFSNCKPDSHATAMNLDILWSTFGENSNAEQIYQDWFSILFAFTTSFQYSKDGFYIAHQMITGFDRALDLFRQLKLNLAAEIDNGMTYNQFCMKTYEIYKYLFPNIKLPEILNGYDPAFNVIQPITILLMLQSQPFFLTNFLDESQQKNPEIYNYILRLNSTFDKFLNDFRKEIDDFYLRVVAKVTYKSIIPNLLQVYKQSWKDTKDEELEDLQNKMMEIAPDMPMFVPKIN